MPTTIEQSKPKRLAKLEDHYKDSFRNVSFENEFGGEWMVYISGHFADFEIKEISAALKAANKAGLL